MESSITDQETFGADLQLAEPHFDDEATLLSARPVVPLPRLEAQARSGRLLVFGAVVVVAVMVGALGATLVYKQRGQVQQPAQAETATSISEPTTAENPSSSEAGGATIKTGEAKPGAENETDAATRTVSNADAAKEIASLVSQDAATGKRATGQSEAVNKKDRKGMRRTERSNAALKKAAKTGPRGEARTRQSSDGLLRVREIFEGPPRP
jgi:type IV secretory pathway VirB10-like protein